eukprot:FR738883.1.p1 GENE.FR738883.1~~FR738883.1.p1  ORF type:complete len:138 (+),score=9.25 FR738883.1:3-416(+)
MYKTALKQGSLSVDAPAWCGSGVWQYSQHPNYAGNLMMWGSVFVLAAPALARRPGPAGKGLVLQAVSLAKNNRALLAAAISPVFIWILLSGQAVGTVTSAAADAEARYGTDPRWIEYRATTPLIFPWAPRNPWEKTK